MPTKSGKLFLINEPQPADHWSHYTPCSQLEPFRIDPAAMGMFDRLPRPSARLRRVPIAGSLAPLRRRRSLRKVHYSILWFKTTPTIAASRGDEAKTDIDPIGART